MLTRNQGNYFKCMERRMWPHRHIVTYAPEHETVHLSPTPTTKSLYQTGFFLISMDLTGFVYSSSIKPGYSTDHSIISLSLSLNNNPRGRGFWKFNGSLLQDTNYVTLVKKVIDETVVINKRQCHSYYGIQWKTIFGVAPSSIHLLKRRKRWRSWRI